LTRAGERLVLSGAALVAVGAAFCLMGSVAAAYGPLLEHLTRRYEVSLSVTHLGLGWVPAVLSAVAFGCLGAFALAARLRSRSPS
jgi:hypothetical protein